MAATAISCKYLPGVVFEKEQELPVNRKLTLKIFDEGLRIGSVVIAHCSPL
jgi:hypothetical protein